MPIAKTEAELQRIETGIAIATTKLLERRETVMDNLSRLKKTLVIHRVLSAETIGCIFSILRDESVSIPHELHKAPPQITLSHVCSKWREIALQTPALWNDVKITRPDSHYWVQVATELLLNRAGRRGVNLALDMEDLIGTELGNTFYAIILPLHVKNLHLTLSSSELEGLLLFLQDSDDISANIDEISLNITSHYNQVSNAPHWFLRKIRSMICSNSPFIRQHQHLPWTQMRYLNTCNIYLPASTVSNILWQSPLLEACKIKVKLDEQVEVEPDDPAELPQLRIFHMIFRDGPPRHLLDAFLQSFKCPNLMDLRIEIPHWTLGTYNIIRNHYNLIQLLKLNLAGYPYPISKVVNDAPVLQELIIARKFLFLDESALHAISSGTLGCCLTSLGFRGNFNVRGVLDMIAARQRCAQQIVEAGRGWQDQISVIKRIFVLDNDRESYEQEFKEEVEGLKKMGIDVYYPDDSDSDTASSDSDSDSEDKY
ncbi:hypothetical protein M378DRAFT_28428 [Amanita muscaria Koide BX008]|uniref:Uncharacterized protein n=1 Tax=Amanita muscaria (strain Koide BX008) TaxID=946122 RepID=A0A0C2WIT8_AMAMK|nr:hypothetical protein M378DRAFT_28428 [Amanita muscaria Koide BX008]